MYDKYLLEKLDEIERQVKNLNWVLDHQVYLQSIKELKLSSYDSEIENVSDTKRMGFALRLKTQNGLIKEVRSSLSRIDEIKDIKSPAKGEAHSKKFINIKKPHSTSIPGDYSKSVDMNASPTQSVLDDVLAITKNYQIPFNHHINVGIENRVIYTPGYETLIENSLRTDYQISARFSVRGIEYNLNRRVSGRTLELNMQETIVDLVNACISRFKSPGSFQLSDPVVLLHPDVIGSILSNFFNYIEFEDYVGTKIGDNNLQIYDDPLRNGGYYSFLFDDAGTQTKSKQIVEDGIVINNISSRSIEDTGSGNSFRVDAFQPTKRSYQYPLKRSVTNIVVTGGTGMGKYFVDRPEFVLVVRQGYVYPGLTSENSEFILHINEADMWRDGDLVGPVPNLTITGKIIDLLEKGRFSADLQMLVDISLPLSIYTGWVTIPPSTVSIRS